MLRKRTTTLLFVGAGLILFVWLATAGTSNFREAAPVPAARPSRLEARGAALADEISRLHDRLRPSTLPRQPGRNLFSFQRRVAAATPPIAPLRPAPSEAAPSRPPPPRIKLSGIAEEPSDAGVVRTAIVSAFGQLFMVKEGEAMTSRYRVERISSDVLELSDQTDGSVLRIALP